MFFASRQGYTFAGSTPENDFMVSVLIVKWTGLVMIALTAMAMINGCQDF